MLASNIKKGMLFSLDDRLYKVLDFQLSKKGRGASIMKTKLKDVENGHIIEKKFNPDTNLNRVNLTRRQMQYLYKDNDLYYFMDTETFEQIPIMKEIVSDTLNYIKEQDEVNIVYWENKIIDIEPPLFVELEVTKCDPGIQGDSSRAGDKDAVLETGLDVRVPLFVNKGDIVKIDTRDGSYVERVKN
ncbi:MAG: elongation factor P [Candidatus Woesearchaeota archaeon]